MDYSISQEGDSMDKCNVNDLMLLSGISKILLMFSPALNKEIEVEKSEKLGLRIKSIENDDTILNCDVVTENKISGKYLNVITGEYETYTINKLFDKILLLRICKTYGEEIYILRAINSRYGVNIIDIIVNGVKKICLSDIADLQLLTSEEKESGLVLTRQLKDSKKTN